MNPQDTPLTRLRAGHERSVLELLRRHGPLTRAALGRHSGLSRTTLYDIVGSLVARGAVVAAPPGAGERRRGRPVETLSLNPDAGLAVGVDFARRAVHVAAVNVAHEPIGSASAPHPARLPWAERVALAERLIGSLAGGALRLDALDAIGIGLVGPVSQQDAGESELEPVALLRERFGVPVLVDNNTRLAALAEATWGAGAGAPDVLYLRLSHGVGGGLVVGGALHRGPRGLSGEFGHVVVEPGGRACECGGVGCLETVASLGAVLAAFHAEAGGPAPDLDRLLDAAGSTGEGPEVVAARAVLAEVGERVGAVLAAACQVVGPGLVVLGGELARAGEALTRHVQRAIEARVMPTSRRHVALRRATLGEAGGALGGIALVLHGPASPGGEAANGPG
ncbi:ROK family transcriptional regulator, partial [Streptomyces triticirhizae]